MTLFNYECDEVKQIIEEVSPNYPQLTTYEKEWIFFHKYHYIPGIPVELEYQEVIVNPTGTVQNAIPYSYKSAILKGSTKYRDIDTGDILDKFDETKNLELVSVKMPVLTTTGKNLNPTRIEPSGLYDSTGTNNNDSSHCRTDDFINVTPNQVLTVSSDQQINRIFGYDADGNYLGIGNGGNILSYGYLNKKEHTFTVPNNCYKIKITSFVNTTTYFQIEEGSTATPYEPFKSNILTANEEVELRGIGEVKDELDLTTGKLTQRVGEVVLDGSEAWEFDNNSNLSNTNRFYTKKVIVDDAKFSPSNTLNDAGLIDLPTGTSSNDNEHICIFNGKVYIRKNKTECLDLSTFKNWLSSNPITVQYELVTKSVKTVDLTTLTKPYEGTNNYQLTANIPCEAILEVPVVSTGEQTLQEINNY